MQSKDGFPSMARPCQWKVDFTVSAPAIKRLREAISTKDLMRNSHSPGMKGLLGSPNASPWMELNHGSISLCPSERAISAADKTDCPSKEATADILANRRYPEAFCTVQDSWDISLRAPFTADTLVLSSPVIEAQLQIYKSAPNISGFLHSTTHPHTYFTTPTTS
jgi:hypothetical protein